ncbi:MAG: GIY-YIG nuclease family protein [Cyclobacteriaceae bacterium]
MERRLCKLLLSLINALLRIPMTNDRHTVLYTGVTNNLESRIFDHKVKRDKRSFTARYNCRNLVYHEAFIVIKDAIHREKQLKKIPTQVERRTN